MASFSQVHGSVIRQEFRGRVSTVSRRITIANRTLCPWRAPPLSRGIAHQGVVADTADAIFGHRGSLPVGKSMTNESRFGERRPYRPSAGEIRRLQATQVRVKFGQGITMFGRRMINWRTLGWRFGSEHAIAARHPDAQAAGIYLRWLF